MKKALRALKRVNPVKTIWFNFRVFHVKQAIKFPVVVGWSVKIEGCKRGCISLPEGIKPGMLLLGITGSPDLDKFNSSKSYFGIKNNGRIVLGGKAHFAKHTSVLVNNSIMHIGKNFSCNNGTRISCVGEGIMIGDDFLCGGDVVIRDSDGHHILEIDPSKQNVNEKKSSKVIKIGNHVWVCNKCDILKGTEIGDHCVVAYGSLCTKAFHVDNALIAGKPAKIIQYSVDWKK